MGRFNWVNGHSKQSSGPKHIFPQEWFGKSSVEPSRQALNDLMKEYGVGKNDSTGVVRSRSRTNTTSSGRSFYGRTSSEQPTYVHSRPTSRHSNAEESTLTAPRAETATREFLSKGTRLIRRQGSKLITLPAQLERTSSEADMSMQAMYEVSPTRSSTPGLTYSPRREVTRNISAPFDFHHVIHTDQGHFQTLSNASEVELANKFSAVQAGQEPVTDVRGIPVEDIPSLRSSPTQPNYPHIQSPTHIASHELPMTPPRPQPPPKDLLQSPFSPSDVRASRSVENFSRPTRSPTLSVETSPFGDQLASITLVSPLSGYLTGPPTPSSWVESMFDSLANVGSSRRGSTANSDTNVKPLPLLPLGVHAVSPDDNTLLPLRSVPLDDVPEEDDAALSEQHDIGSSTLHRASLRHSQTFPSDRTAKKQGASAGDFAFENLLADPTTSPKTSLTRSETKKKRISIGLKNIVIEDWEDAVDYSWDHPADLEDDEEGDHMSNGPVTPPGEMTQETYLVVQQPPVEHDSSSSSTPLMMQQSPKETSFGREASIPTILHSNEPHDENTPMAQGLGIDSLQSDTSTELKDYFHQSHGVDEAPVGTNSLFPSVHCDPGTPMSTASSQDSFAPSFASSVVGTHRSSNSSASLSEFSNSKTYEESLPEDHIPIFLENITSNGSQETVQTVKHIPSAATPDPVALTQPDTPISPSTNVHSVSLIDKPLPASPQASHEREVSLSNASTSERPCSIMSQDTIKPLPPKTRQHCNTPVVRPRKTSRASYSLFPVINPNPPPQLALT